MILIGKDSTATDDLGHKLDVDEDGNIMFDENGLATQTTRS